MSNPFLIDGPACISFSGGRTSGYMLWRILQAHGGKLPDDVVVCFANSGKEMLQTLDFVQECGERWNVPIVWLEYCEAPADAPRYKVVNYSTASRNGEPFEAAIKRKQYLPNPVTRFCTVELKIRTMHRYLRTVHGFDYWTSYIGIRADEPRRVAKLSVPTETTREERIAPLALAGIGVEEVGAFWINNDFDLRLPNMNGRTMHGNCDLCFLKGGDQILSLVREEPERAKWWMKMEALALALASKPSGAVFRSDRPSYTEMHRMATSHGELFAFGDESIEDCACTD